VEISRRSCRSCNRPNSRRPSILKAGVLEDGRLIETTEGTPQRFSGIPLLANVYLRYVYDLWSHSGVRATQRVVRYADDTIAGFQYRQDAERFQIDLKERLAKFALSTHPLAHYCSTKGAGWPA
jgi:RNA-directed DNA polymerase